MFTITVEGKANGNLYYSPRHVMPVAKRMASTRARKGDPARIAVLDTTTGTVTPVNY